MSIVNSSVNIENFNVYNYSNGLSKVCIQCQINKPLTKYYFDKSHSDGLRCECKPCHIKKAKQRRENNKLAIIASDYRKQCSTCKQYISKDKFIHNCNYKDNVNTEYKSCDSIKTKQYSELSKQIITKKIFNEHDVNKCFKCEQGQFLLNFMCLKGKTGLKE